MNERRPRQARNAGDARDARERSRTAVPGRDAASSSVPWSVPVPVAEIPQTGRHFELTADAGTRQAVAGAAGIVALPRLEAAFDVAPLANDGVRVRGTVSAVVEQSCVVTLDPVTSEVREEVDLTFVASRAPAPAGLPVGAADADHDPPELLQDGLVDLGVVATELLILGIDPYPRKPGAAFEAPPETADPAQHPFAALAALKKPDSGGKPS